MLMVQYNTVDSVASVTHLYVAISSFRFALLDLSVAFHLRCLEKASATPRPYREIPVSRGRGRKGAIDPPGGCIQTIQKQSRSPSASQMEEECADLSFRAPATASIMVRCLVLPVVFFLLLWRRCFLASDCWGKSRVMRDFCKWLMVDGWGWSWRSGEVTVRVLMIALMA